MCKLISNSTLATDQWESIVIYNSITLLAQAADILTIVV